MKKFIVTITRYLLQYLINALNEVLKVILALGSKTSESDAKKTICMLFSVEPRVIPRKDWKLVSVAPMVALWCDVKMTILAFLV